MRREYALRPGDLGPVSHFWNIEATLPSVFLPSGISQSSVSSFQSTWVMPKSLAIARVRRSLPSTRKNSKLTEPHLAARVLPSGTPSEKQKNTHESPYGGLQYLGILPPVKSEMI